MSLMLRISFRLATDVSLFRFVVLVAVFVVSHRLAFAIRASSVA